MPKKLKYFTLLLFIGCFSCTPFADLHQLEKEVLQQFPYSSYTQSWRTSDTLIFYTPKDLKNKLHQVDRFQDQMALLEPTPQWPAEKRALYEELNRYLLELDAHFSSFQSDPSIYNLGGRLVQNLSDPRLNSEEKSQRCLQHLEKASLYYRTAQLCIKRPAPERLQLAIQKQLAGLQLMEGALPDSLHNGTYLLSGTTSSKKPSILPNWPAKTMLPIVILCYLKKGKPFYFQKNNHPLCLFNVRCTACLNT
jgi:hypothetical protein